MKVLRVYHAGRDAAHRARERALVAAGVDLTLVVPTSWSGADHLHPEPFEVVELAVQRPGDVNRHVHADSGHVRALLRRLRPDVVDLHEEPFSSVTRQWLAQVGPDQAVVAYSAQNLDKRWPPPFAQYETAALARLQALYPCSRQVASVLRGKGYTGPLHVLPLGLDLERLAPGGQRHDDPVLTLLLVGRLVPEKGVLDAVRVLQGVRGIRPARLLLVGSGPEAGPAQQLARELGVADALEVRPWAGPDELAALYRAAHMVLVPSRATRTWVEQFGRVITEGQATGAVVVGYASGSVPEVLGERGVVVPEGDVAALSSAVTALAQDPDRWQQLRDAGLRHVRGLDWGQVAEATVRMYEQALAAPRRLPVAPDRAAARREFGPPAEVAGGGRPFALPVLREDTRLSRGLAAVVDGFEPLSRTARKAASRLGR